MNPAIALMKSIILALFLAFSSCAFGASGKIAPYVYDYDGSPVDAAVSSLNPPPGSTVIDTVAGTHYRKISAVDSNATYAVEQPTLVTATTPVTTATITASTSGANEVHYITPAATIAALTFTFPTNANSRIGQEITLFSTQIVTTLTVSSSGLTLKGTGVTELAVNTPIKWIKVAASTWARIL